MAVKKVVSKIIIWVMLIVVILYVIYLGLELRNRKTSEENNISVTTQSTETSNTSTNKDNIVDIKGYVYYEGDNVGVHLDNGEDVIVNFSPYFPDGTHVIVSIDENDVVRGISELIK
jgi:hypothetical protein